MRSVQDRNLQDWESFKMPKLNWFHSETNHNNGKMGKFIYIAINHNKGHLSHVIVSVRGGK